MNDHLPGKDLFIRFTASAFRRLLSIYVFSCFPFGFEGRMWDLIISVPHHCLSFYSAVSGLVWFGSTVCYAILGAARSRSAD